MPDRHVAEFETRNLTLSVIDPEQMGIGALQRNPNPIVLHVEDVEAARAQLEEHG